MNAGPRPMVDCKCGHARTLHPERNDEACRVPTCDCEEYIPHTIDQLIPTPGRKLEPVARVDRPPLAIPEKPTPATSAEPTFDQVIAAASRSDSKKIVALGGRMVELNAQLRTLLREEREQAEERRKAVAEQEKARAEVERLQRELTAAQQRLRATASSGTVPCPDCDFAGVTPQGLGIHRAKVHGYRAAG